MDLRAMHKCAVFVLAVIACSSSHFVSSVEGRQMKSASKNVDSAMHNEDHHHHQPGAPVSIPNASEKQVMTPPILPTKSSDFGDSVTVTRSDDDSGPTTPGNSPGVGLFLAQDDEDVEQNPGSISSTDMYSIPADKEDFRHTSPGHSPGVGHAFASKHSEP